jgi:ABC-type lipoprotein export system ATPase subunit
MNTTRPNPPPPLPGTIGNAVTATQVTRRYGTGTTAVEALRGVSLAVCHGELAAIMGPSGSGKSTLLHILAGLDRPTSGEVTIGERPLAALGDRDLTLLRRTQVGFVFQFFNLLPMLTAEGNIVLPLKLAGKRPDPAWVDELIGKVSLSDRRGHLPAQLSGGQQQRVAIARALVSRRPHRAARRRPDRRRARAPVGSCHPPGNRESELTMFNVVMRGLWARESRAVLTMLAVVLGVAMISGTFVLMDTVMSAYSGIFSAAYSRTDAVVTAQSPFGAIGSAKQPVPASLLDRIRALPEAQQAHGYIDSTPSSPAPPGRPSASPPRKRPCSASPPANWTP